MNHPRINLGEMMLGVAFAGLFSAVVAWTWDGFFALHGIVAAFALLVPMYLVALLMLRRHRTGS